MTTGFGRKIPSIPIVGWFRVLATNWVGPPPFFSWPLLWCIGKSASRWSLTSLSGRGHFPNQGATIWRKVESKRQEGFRWKLSCKFALIRICTRDRKKRVLSFFLLSAFNSASSQHNQNHRRRNHRQRFSSLYLPINRFTQCLTSSSPRMATL